MSQQEVGQEKDTYNLLQIYKTQIHIAGYT